jgi:hypothetical protein
MSARGRRPTHRRHAVSCFAVLAIAVLAVAGTAGTASAAVYSGQDCSTSSNTCDTGWIDLGADGTDAIGIYCGGNNEATGYSTQATSSAISFAYFGPESSQGITLGYVFSVTNWDPSTDHHFVIFVDCPYGFYSGSASVQATASQARTSATRDSITEIHSVDNTGRALIVHQRTRLRPNRLRSYSVSCPAGYKMHDYSNTIAYHTRKRPKRQHALETSRVHQRRRVATQVITGGGPVAKGKVELRTLVQCWK